MVKTYVFSHFKLDRIRCGALLNKSNRNSFIYFSHKRKVFLERRNDFTHSPYVYQEENEEIEERIVRFRTVGDELYGSCRLTQQTISEVVGEIRLYDILKESSN
jgi:hypothetical protein